MAALELELPPHEEQSAIADCLLAVDREMESLQSLVEQFREQRRGLMQKLFSGELDLSKLTVAAEEVLA